MKIPRPTLKRLCEICRYLEKMIDAGRKNIFSDEIGEGTGIPPYHVRKDINYLGEIGTPGRGYNAPDLLDHLTKALCIAQTRKAVLVGVGRLGSALLNYAGITQTNYEYLGAFDADPAKAGKSENGILIHPVSDISAFVKKNAIELAVLSLPREHTQEVVDLLVEAGITGILNFAPVEITVPKHVVKRSIDFTLEMKVLTAVKTIREGEKKAKKKTLSSVRD